MKSDVIDINSPGNLVDIIMLVNNSLLKSWHDNVVNLLMYAVLMQNFSHPKTVMRQYVIIQLIGD